MKRNKQIDVKRALALSGALHFLVCCARACLLPFLTLFFRRLGLTPAMTGVVMGTKHLITLVCSPLGSLLAKRYDKRRAVMICSLSLSAVVPLVLLLLPSAGVHGRSDTCNTSDVSTTTTQSLMSSITKTTASTQTHPETSSALVPRSNTTLAGSKSAPLVVNTSLQQPEVEKSHPQMQQVNASSVENTTIGETNQTSGSSSTPVRKKRSKTTTEGETRGGHFGFLGSLKAMDAQHQLFFLVLITVSVWEAVAAPLEWTADDGRYEYLDFADASDRYSSTGVWGLLGAACGVGGAGLLVSQLRCLVADQTTRSGVHFYCYVAVVALALPVVTLLPLHVNKKRDKANGLLKALQLVRGSPRALLCAATTVLVGAASAAVDNFLLWQMQDHGSNKLHMALSVALALLSQAAFPLLASRISKVLASGRVLAVGAATLGLQCFYYSFLWAPWAALPAQAFSCLSAGTVWWAVRAQCEDLATPGSERSVSRIYSALCLHLGSGLGSFGGGLVAQRFGLTWLFRGVALCLMVWCV
ncbi:LOW QUALITY PROTEIN: major facilitator superfamily domain-containing protein 6-like [Labrus mixtus]|uniref:LOW QUALITY PROTEIN: major facilitator superfamily domain-containing protein 6-like n=1 Tax=Labrus mixtus TaxID=508554 RepID=UPI0029C0E5D2|nr:LOW QUALITY PROTEIN: major facilitator superfamily domain-containing protein 6-like [Labrus mixtus]